jgi:hypothetical protein
LIDYGCTAPPKYLLSQSAECGTLDSKKMVVVRRSFLKAENSLSFTTEHTLEHSSVSLVNYSQVDDV